MPIAKVNGVETEPVIDPTEYVVEQPGVGRCGAPRRRRRTRGPIRRGNELTAAPIGDPFHALGPGGHLEVEDPLILGNKPAGPLQQNTQLGIGVG